MRAYACAGRCVVVPRRTHRVHTCVLGANSSVHFDYLHHTHSFAPGIDRTTTQRKEHHLALDIFLHLVHAHPFSRFQCDGCVLRVRGRSEAAQ